MKIIDKTETPFEYYLKEGRTTVVLKIKDIEFKAKTEEFKKSISLMPISLYMASRQTPKTQHK